jgi:hypothetical protein
MPLAYRIRWCYFGLNVIMVASLACIMWSLIYALSLATLTVMTTETVIALACGFLPL